MPSSSSSIINRHRKRNGPTRRRYRRQSAKGKMAERWDAEFEFTETWFEDWTAIDDYRLEEDWSAQCWFDFCGTTHVVRRAVEILCGGFSLRIQLPSRLETVADGEPSHPSDPAMIQGDSWSLERAVAYLSSNGWAENSAVEAAIQALAGHPYFQEPILETKDAWITALISQLVVLHPFWLRPIDTWRAGELDPRQAVADLTRHLLVRFPVPAWLAPENSRLPFCVFIGQRRFNGGDLYPTENVNSLLLLLAAGRGWSLPKTLEAIRPSHFVLKLGPSVWRHITTVPANSSFEQAWWWMALQALGSDAQLSSDLAEWTQLTEQPVSTSLIPWLQNHRGRLQTQEVHCIVEWAVHQASERSRLNQPDRPTANFSLHGRSLSRVLESANAYILSLLAARVDAAQWPGEHWNGELNFRGQLWVFRELCTSEELKAESQAMRHCVVAYVCRCVEGHSRILSISVDGRRQLTVEVNPQTRQVVQIRGVANRLPTAEEQQGVTLWAQARLLPDASGPGTHDVEVR